MESWAFQIFFASCPEDVLFTLSIMVNIAQFESVEDREQEGETEKRCDHSQESFLSQQCAPQRNWCSRSTSVVDKTWLPGATSLPLLRSFSFLPLDKKRC